MKKLLFLLFAFACAAAQASAQGERTVAYTGATVVNATGQTIKDGVLVIRGGKIVAVGPRSSTRVPEGAQVVDVTGKTIMPGLVDTHSHIGGAAGATAPRPSSPTCAYSTPSTCATRASMRARAGGITTVNIMPGSGHLLSGQTVYLKLRAATTIEDLAITRRRTETSRAESRWRTARTRSARTRRGRFRARAPSRLRSCASSSCSAQEYREKVRRAGGDSDKAAAARPRAGGARRSARRKARRAFPHAPPRRHPDGRAALEGVRLPRRPAPRDGGLEGRRRNRARERPCVDHRR